MSTIVLEVKNVSKSYHLRENINDSLKNTVAAGLNLKQEKTEKFKALCNISFNLSEGEALGIIGENGAGKSTLLRILSGVSQPDEGEVNFYGRAVSILDIGAGFHPELSGRENIYLSAALYKFTQQEIANRIEEIISFSGIERFIDEPVKNYSSGMYLRLAFSIVSCLDADIYLIDEVINVGDANFQNKCKSRMEELIAAGKTLLIASHNMNEMVILCNRFVLMEKGQIIDSGGSDVIQKYMSRTLPQFFSFEGESFYHLKKIDSTNTMKSVLRIDDTGITDFETSPMGISRTSSFSVFIKLNLLIDLELVLRLKIYDSTGILVFVCSSIESANTITKSGTYRIDFIMPANLFNDRLYSADLVLIDLKLQSILMTSDKFLTFKIADKTSDADIDLKINSPGIVRPLIHCSVSKQE